MDERQQCEFLLVRYVPDAIKDEFINIGVVLLSRDSGSAQVAFTRDWRRVRALDPQADIAMLEALEGELRERLRENEGRERMLHLFRDSFANLVQVSLPTALLSAAPDQEMGRLLEMYTGRIPRRATRESAGRAAMVAQMREAFTQAGVWRRLVKKIPAAQYTYRGDPLQIDCGYRPNGVLKLFHAVPLKTGLDSAKALAFSYPLVRQGVMRLRGAKTELTAIVEDDLPEEEGIGFVRQVFRESEIRLAHVAELPGIAETARQELRA